MHLLLVEDERKVASFIARALREMSYSVDVADTGEKALKLASNVRYDAVVLDVRLPGTTGIEVCRELRQMNLEAPILMVTARTLVDQRVEGLDAGADDYLTKPFALAEFRARVRALTRRGFYKVGATLHCADLELNRHRRIAVRGGEQIALTSKELALLELLMIRSPEITTRCEIVEHVWSGSFDSETNLVEVYINRLRHKLDVENKPKLIHTIRGFGYRFGPPES